MINAEEARNLVVKEGLAQIQVEFAEIFARLEINIRSLASGGYVDYRDALAEYAIPYESKLAIMRVLRSKGFNVVERRLASTTSVKFDVIWGEPK